MTVIPREGDLEHDTCTITVSEYIHLQEEAKFLRILENNGIETWEKYEACLEAWRQNA